MKHEHLIRSISMSPSCLLTPRELEVLGLFSEGRSSKEVALCLALSFRTVEHQIASAKRKLGARNVVHAVAIAVSRQLVEFRA